MTDITELAQRKKFEAWFKSSFHPDKTGPYIKDQLYFAWKAAGAELVEALEKAQAQSSKWLEAYHKAVSIGARYEERIAELESRTVTVKLPDIMPPEAAPAHYWGSGESMAYADGYNKSAADLKTSFALSCSSAGVNVEFE